MTNDTARRDFILGLVFFGTIALLLYYPIVLTGFSFSEKTYMKAWFPDARGLKEGDAVLVAGRPTGTVREVVFDDERPSDRRIGVTMEFSQPPTLREGYTMSIAEFTVLGGRVIEIEPGSGTAPVIRAGAELVGVVRPAALDSFSELLEENSEDFRAIVANLRVTTEDLAEGRGVIGALLNDEALLSDVNTVVDDVSQMMADLGAGRGTLGALLSDENLRSQILGIMEDTQVTIADIRSIASTAKNGEGLLGAMLQDPTLREDSINLVQNLDDVAARLSKVVVDATEGKGLLGTIIADEAVAADAANFLADLSEVVRRLKDGEGSIGRLLAEEQAYDELLIAMKSLNNQLEDAREAQPISAFTQLLFGTF